MRLSGLKVGSFLVKLCVLLSVAAALNTAVDTVNTRRACEKVAPDEHKVVYTGWPFALKYDHRFSDSLDYEIGDFLDVTCIVRDYTSNNILWTKSVVGPSVYFDDKLKAVKYVTPDVTEDSPEEYEIILQTSHSCRRLIVHLNKTSAQEKCEKLPEKLHFNFTAFLREEHELLCKVPESEPGLEGEEIQYTWYHDCTEVKDKYINEMGSLDLNNVGFGDAGTYACKATYKGQSRWVRQHNVCVKYPSTSVFGVSLKCRKIYTADIGKDVSIQCTADMGLGAANSIKVSVFWTKEPGNLDSNRSFCVNYMLGQTSSSSERNDTDCITTSEEKDICYRNDPHLAKAPSNSANLTLRIRGVTPSDFGEYALELKYSQGARASANFTLVLEEDTLLKSEIFAVIVCLCIIVILVSLVITCIFRKYDILWFWKKYFGPYEKETFLHTAYFAYYYNTGEDTMNDRSRSLTKELVENLMEFMDKFGGTLYDDQREVGRGQYEPEAMLQAQNDCHRIIIALTPEYINDQWSLHTTYQALSTVVENGKKVIFITAPGALDALDELPPQPKRTLIYAMKRNILISWNGKSPFNRTLCRKLEYALPKLCPGVGVVPHSQNPASQNLAPISP